MTESAAGLPGDTPLQRSSRDPEQVRARLEAWLDQQLGGGSGLQVPALEGTSANGMSSETLLFDAAWHDPAEGQRREQLVARIAPDGADVPVFPTYDLRRQFDVIRLVGERTSVPVPKVWWCEEDTSHLGARFFVMSRVDGLVPPDVAPYTFGGNWVFDASAEEQATLERSSVGVLAELHTLDPAEAPFLEYDEPGESALRRHVAHARAWYDFAARDLASPSTLVEAAFDWLEAHWPEDEGDTVISWGDSRIGNVMYRDFRPVAVLDWEMVGLGPRELDLAWMVYSHDVFNQIAGQFELPGMPAFLQPDRAAELYEQASGVAIRNLDWYLTYAATQWGIVGLRTGRRSIHFGEREAPADPDELIMNRASLESRIA